MFEISQGDGPNANSNCGGEIAAVRLAAEELANYHPVKATKLAVCLIDSQAAIAAIEDNSIDCYNLFPCREDITHLLNELAKKG